MLLVCTRARTVLHTLCYLRLLTRRGGGGDGCGFVGFAAGARLCPEEHRQVWTNPAACCTASEARGNHAAGGTCRGETSHSAGAPAEPTNKEGGWT